MVWAIAARFGVCVVSVMTPPDPEVVYAEVALPAGTDVTGYGIHPALLDAALHPLAAVARSAPVLTPSPKRCGFRSRLPGSACTPPAATALHVQLARTGAGHLHVARRRSRPARR